MNFTHLSKAGLFLLLPLVTLGWTSVPFLSPYTLHTALILFIVAIALTFVKRANLQLTKTVLHCFIILFLVGATGWFLSPFFFLLYLLPIYLGFLYTPTVAFGFLAALLIIFSSSVGEVDPSLDLLTLLSLLLVIPLVIFLRKKYLILKQSDKDILILQDDASGIADSDTIAALLSNRITKLGVTVRQPLSFVKQAATVLLEEQLTPHEATVYLQRIKTTATEALDQVRQFEGDTSSNQVLTNTNHPKKTIKKP
jgi:hypothetical protein